MKLTPVVNGIWLFDSRIVVNIIYIDKLHFEKSWNVLIMIIFFVYLQNETAFNKIAV